MSKLSRTPSLLVRVKSAHIKSGFRADCRACPVALAIRTAFPNSNVFVGVRNISIDGVFYNMPKSVKQFVRRFDSLYQRTNAKCAPFTFALELRA